jgi:hypothetical protein
MAFTKVFSTDRCKTGGNSACTGQFEWTANRSSTTSDGAFMYDHTVVAVLRKVSNNSIVATHVYGTSAVTSVVQITPTPSYLTHFKRGDLPGPPSVPVAYYVEVYYLNIDGTLDLQTTSVSLTF